jgi:DNA primase
MEIREIKTTLSILTVLDHYHLELNKHDMLKCPFHDDQTPSLKIYPGTNTFYCFGCGATGDQIEFIRLKDNSSKHAAIEKAKTLTNQRVNIKPEKVEHAEVKNLLPRLAVLGKIVQDSKAGLKRTAKARAYLEARGLDPEKIEAGYMGSDFGKGWNPQLKESGLQLGIFKKSGKNTIVPKFRNCVLFFTKNEKGQITDLYGRSITSNPNSNPTSSPTPEGKHFYLGGKHQGIYPFYPPPGTTRLILTESLIDAATLLQLKLSNEQLSHYQVLACYGTNGLTQEHKAAIKELQHLEEIIFFFDGDKAGRDATLKYQSELNALFPGIKLTSADTPEGEDINSLLQGHEPEILAHLINERKPVTPGQKQVPGTPAAPAPAAGAALDISTPHKITWGDNQLHFIIWGGIEKDNIHRLKINLLVQPKGDSTSYYQDDVNLYSNGQLQRYIRGASEELEISGTILKNALRQLKSQIETYRLNLIEAERKALKPKSYPMTIKEQKEAERFLKHENLVQNTLRAISKSGLVGEQQNGLLLFFLYLSRLMEDPLHAIIFGKSGSGKTYLQTKISECLPEESVRTITSLTENTLYYSSREFWKHKLLLIEDLEGVYNAFLPLREFMSKQSISKLTTDKDAKGNNIQKVLVVEGPVCVSGATTKSNIYEDNANRSFLLHVDESPAHAKEVMGYQRRQQAGMVNEAEQQKYKKLLQNSQRLLKQIRIINPYATMLDIPECVFKKLRTNMHYLRLIEIITFYHQYQREVKTTNKNGDPVTPYITTTPEDIAWANNLIRDSLLRKSDELSGQVRHFFESLKSFAERKEDPKTIYAKEVREAFRMNPMTINRYLRELESRGYIQRNGGNRKSGFEYEIKAWDEYEKLKSGIDILDDILEQVKAKYNSQNQPKARYNTSITEV